MAVAVTKDDLGKITFKIFPGMPYPIRLALALASVAAGIAVQLSGVEASRVSSMAALIVGALGVFFGILLLMVDSKTNEPKRVRGKKSWERVTEQEYARIKALVKDGKRWARRDAFGANNLVGCLMFLLVALGLFIAFGALLAEGENRLARVLAVDAGLFLLLTFFSGTRKAWAPADLIVKIDALTRVLDRERHQPTPRLKVQPMMEVQKGARDRSLPRDVRLLGTVEKAPEDLIGFQIQCSINRVSNTPYPYVYAVIIARKAFDLQTRIARYAVSAKDLVSFEEADDEVDVVVLRQKTTKTSGYHTKDADQDRIVQEAAAITLGLANE